MFPLFSIVFLTNIEAAANTLSHRVLTDKHAMEEETHKKKKNKKENFVTVADTVTDEASPGVGDKSRHSLKPLFTVVQ